ncbi:MULTISPECIES: efflux RND transporter periplasmic adaptor subunit [Bacillaceae]|uniref:efflux RND transporter periplasmic adaptor subunit n=1 Tax=Bacillaceae TaxID=186817 RepID=UPI002FFF0EC9
MKKKIWMAIGIVVLLLLMISVSVYRQVFAKGPTVKAAEMKQEAISSLLMIPGSIKLEEEQLVYPAPEKGELKELLVTEGQKVTKGTVIARLQNSQLDLEAEQNKIAIESANLKIAQLDKQVKQLNDKEKTLAEQVGKVEAKNQLSAEYTNLDTEKKLASLDLKQANLQKDIIGKKQLDLEIKSEIDGVVLTAKKPETTNQTTALSPYIHIGKQEGMIATGLLSEYDTLKVHNGQKVILRSDAVPGKEWSGVVDKLAYLPQSDQNSLQTGNQAVQYPVTVKITGDVNSLKPGFQMIMEIETDKKQSNVLPIEAVHDDGNQPYVFLVKDGKAKQKKVKTGITSGEKIEILNGISKDDQVIIDGPDKLKDGMDVTIK